MSKLDRRLSAIYDMVKGGTVADIGTDHALLPVALVSSGRCHAAYACDIGVGPLDSAARTIAAAGLSERIERVRCDGIPPQCCQCDTVIIAGMGGLLIADILSRANLAAHTQLLLQPMTKAPELRRWLLDHGFCIKMERYVRQGKMLYVILDARRGTSEPYTPADIEVGKFTDCPVGKEYVRRRVELLCLRRDNEGQVGHDITALQNLIEELEKRL